MKLSSLYALLVVTTFFLACSRDIPADPSCRTNPQLPINDPAAAACLIKLDGKLVALQTKHNNLWLLPRLQLQKNLSAQCTAHQAAWKNTGLNVEVNQLLYVDPQNTHFYSCVLSDSYSRELQSLNVPPWATRDVTKVALVDPFASKNNKWAPSLELIEIRQAFIKIESNVPLNDGNNPASNKAH